MAIPLNKALYEKAKLIADETYDKPSAYKSGFIVKTYKKMGGKYKNIDKEKDLKRWYEEGWTDINPLKSETSYPVYRPTKRINKNTPLTVDEIDKTNLLEQSLIKQVIKGKKNLKPFKEIEGSRVPLAFGDYKIDPYAYKQAKKLNITIKPSKKKYKKIDIFDKNDNYIMSVGDTRYNDYRSYIKEKGYEYADTRRRLYKIRHQRNRLKEGTASFYADQLLW
jgi:hypothetical protein